MLYWSLMFFVFSLVAGVLGFGGIAGASTHVAQVLFFLFIVAFLVSLISNAVRGRSPQA